MRIEPRGVTRWAVQLPSKRLTIACRVDPDELGSLFFFAHFEDEHVNMELVPKLTTLMPGESRSVNGWYSLTELSPKRL